MSNRFRAAEIARDPETGRVTSYVEEIRPPRWGGGGMLVGLAVGAVLALGALAAYAVSVGGLAAAGARADAELAAALASFL